MRQYFRSKKKYSVLLLFLLLVVLIFLQQILVIPGAARLPRAFNDALHVPFFFGITLLVNWILHFSISLQFRKIISCCFLICIILAFATEFIQNFTGRNASLWDIGFDLIGIVSAILFILGCKYRKRFVQSSILAFILSVMLFCSGFYQVSYIALLNQTLKDNAPRLIDANGSTRQLSLMLSGEWEVVNKQDVAGLDEFSSAEKILKIYLTNAVEYPGITLNEPFSDWSSYKNIIVGFYLPGESSIPVTIRVETNNDKGQEGKVETFIMPGFMSLKLPIRSIVRDENDNLSQVERVLIFSTAVEEEREFYLVDLMLE